FLQAVLREQIHEEDVARNETARRARLELQQELHLDTFYAAFHDRFRGSRDEIKRRVAVYLPTIRAAGAGTTEAPALDVGCGRGELLELLAENGLVARGVDRDDAMIEDCLARNLEVVRDDAIDHLRTIDAGSLGAITGMHVIE